MRPLGSVIPGSVRPQGSVIQDSVRLLGKSPTFSGKYDAWLYWAV